VCVSLGEHAAGRAGSAPDAVPARGGAAAADLRMTRRGAAAGVRRVRAARSSRRAARVPRGAPGQRPGDRPVGATRRKSEASACAISGSSRQRAAQRLRHCWLKSAAGCPGYPAFNRKRWREETTLSSSSPYRFSCACAYEADEMQIDEGCLFRPYSGQLYDNPRRFPAKWALKTAHDKPATSCHLALAATWAQ
jgi:hypothetical protein